MRVKECATEWMMTTMVAVRLRKQGSDLASAFYLCVCVCVFWPRQNTEMHRSCSSLFVEITIIANPRQDLGSVSGFFPFQSIHWTAPSDIDEARQVNNSYYSTLRYFAEDCIALTVAVAQESLDRDTENVITGVCELENRKAGMGVFYI